MLHGILLRCTNVQRGLHTQFLLLSAHCFTQNMHRYIWLASTVHSLCSCLPTTTRTTTPPNYTITFYRIMCLNYNVIMCLVFSHLSLQRLAVAHGQGRTMWLPGVTGEMKSTSVWQITPLDGWGLASQGTDKWLVLL